MWTPVASSGVQVVSAGQGVPVPPTCSRGEGACITDDMTAADIYRLSSRERQAERERTKQQMDETLRRLVDRLGICKEQVVGAVTGKRFSLLHGLLVQCDRFTSRVAMHPDVLAVTGAGVLVHDAGLWGLAGRGDTSALAAAILARWRAECAGSVRKSDCQTLWPLGHTKALAFMDAVALFKTACVALNEKVPPRIAELAAKACALRGFSRVVDLFVVPEGEILTWSDEPSVRALLSHVVRFAVAEDEKSRRATRSCPSGGAMVEWCSTMFCLGPCGTSVACQH